MPTFQVMSVKQSLRIFIFRFAVTDANDDIVPGTTVVRNAFVIGVPEMWKVIRSVIASIWFLLFTLFCIWASM
jgi:hypothetical protein